MTKWVYSFSAEHAEGRAEMKNLLGGKGANLHEMASLALPVPPGFTITTEVCSYFYANSKTYPADLGHCGVDLGAKVGGIGFAVGVEKGADLGGDGEARRHGESERSHLVQVRALAAEQILHLRPPFRAIGAEAIDPLRHVSPL